MGNVNNERRAAYGCVVGEPWMNTQVFGGGQRGKASGEQTVNVVFRQPGVLQRIVSSFGVML
jgi:hypothetical protein